MLLCKETTNHWWDLNPHIAKRVGYVRVN